jgi:DNA-binding transcriptional ArsR family regulator
VVLATAEKQAELNAALARAFAALADPTRCAVVELLRERPQRASDLAAALELAPAGLSRHLRQLERSGLVAADAVTHDARVRLYRLEPHVFASLSDWAATMYDEWSQQLRAFKAHAEAGTSHRAAKRGKP